MTKAAVSQSSLDLPVKQPRFGILRFLGDISNVAPDDGIDMRHLWKYDENIHELQFSSIIDIDTIPKPPSPPKRRFSFGTNKAKEITDEEKKYQLKVEEAQKKNATIQLYAEVKKQSAYTCNFCGFVDPKYIEIHHKDGDHFNETRNNLVTACTLCHRQHHLLWLSIYDQADLGSANCPELTQTEFNHLQRIAIVMNGDEKFTGLLGLNGRLGSMLAPVSNNFSRPLHAFMIPDEKKRKHKELYILAHPIKYDVTNKEASYQHIELALRKLDSMNLTDAEKAAIQAYDGLIKLADEKKLTPTIPDEEIRNQHRNKITDAINKYNKAYEDAFESEFNTDRKKFTIFELAMSLKQVDYAFYKNFAPQYLYLIFKPNIFSEEQIAYYKSLDYFDVSSWGFNS